MEDAIVSGARRDTPKFEPLSLSTNLFEVVLLPRIETFPDTATDAALTAPVVLIVVEPPMTDAPFMVPAVITGLFNVLLLRVSEAF